MASEGFSENWNGFCPAAVPGVVRTGGTAVAAHRVLPALHHHVKRGPIGCVVFRAFHTVYQSRGIVYLMCAFIPRCDRLLYFVCGISGSH